MSNELICIVYFYKNFVSNDLKKYITISKYDWIKINDIQKIFFRILSEYNPH